MKRYKLTKDLPTFNKGDTFRLTGNGSLERESDRTIAYMASTLEKFDILDSDWFEEIPEDYTRWRAKRNDSYYWLTEDLGVVEEREDGCALDERLYAAGNYFKTEKEARKAANWLKAFAVLRDDTRGLKPDWENSDQDKWHVYYDHHEKELAVNLVWTQQGGPLHFATQEDAEASIKNHEREWLTYFNCGGGNE